jgi:hypothetical protein
LLGRVDRIETARAASSTTMRSLLCTTRNLCPPSSYAGNNVDLVLPYRPDSAIAAAWDYLGPIVELYDA